jgi:hypothetical protein
MGRSRRWCWDSACNPCRFSASRRGSRSRPGRAAGEGFHQPDELPDFPYFLLKRFASEFLTHLRFHNAGSFN